MSVLIKPIEPAHRSTLGALVTDQLRDHVIHGHFAPGSVLGEVELADRFGVSRGPVREALQRLVQEGLLRREPRRGISVPVLTDQDVDDLFVARAAIEGAALQVLLSGNPDRLIHELGRIVEEMRVAVAEEDWVQVADLDMDFHRRVVEAAGSPRLTRLYASVIAETRICFSLTARYPGREHLVDEHEDLAMHLAVGDRVGVLAALRDHLSASIATLARHRPRQARALTTDRLRLTGRRPGRRSRSARSAR